MVYEDILCMGLSTRNVKKVIKIVLEKLAGVECERLPKATFSKYMLIETRGLAELQIAAELANCEDNDLVLQSDGTSKKGHSYTTFDATNNEGQFFVLGMREVGAGDAQTQLDLLKEIMGDISSFKKEDIYGKFFLSVKNLMSDHCNTEKKFNKLFIDCRSQIIPKMKSDWETLSSDEQNKLLNVHEYFCGLHYLVALADTSEVSLKLWESLIFDDPKKVGSLNYGSYSNGESGPLRLIRTVCKLVQERRCEKSGKMVTFATFLKETHQVINLPLYPFLGNRFNILFLNGAGVFYLLSYLEEFLNNVSLENKLMSAVFHDLQVLAFEVACQALGLIDKLVSGPLWRMMVKEKEVLSMSTHYQSVYEFFKEGGEDATAFLNSESRPFPDLVVEDGRLTALLEFEENDSQMMLKQCLELIFGGFVSVTERMLQDHIAGGKYATPNEDLRKESIAVPTTNANPERDFGILDRLMNIKPKALDLVYEGMVMFTRNNTSKWRGSVTKEKLAEVMKIARKSKSKQKDLYLKRKVVIQKSRAERLQNKIAEKKEKELALTLEKEKLTFQIEETGGLWSTANCHTEKERRAALKIQLSFRLKVLGSSCDKRYFFLLAKGKIRTAELLANLMTVIKETSINHLSEPQHQIYHEPIIIDQEKLIAGKKSLVSQGKRNSTDKIIVMAKKKKK